MSVGSNIQCLHNYSLFLLRYAWCSYVTHACASTSGCVYRLRAQLRSSIWLKSMFYQTWLEGLLTQTGLADARNLALDNGHWWHQSPSKVKQYSMVTKLGQNNHYFCMNRGQRSSKGKACKNPFKLNSKKIVDVYFVPLWEWTWRHNASVHGRQRSIFQRTDKNAHTYL